MHCSKWRFFIFYGHCEGSTRVSARGNLNRLCYEQWRSFRILRPKCRLFYFVSISKTRSAIIWIIQNKSWWSRLKKRMSNSFVYPSAIFTAFKRISLSSAVSCPERLRKGSGSTLPTSTALAVITARISGFIPKPTRSRFCRGGLSTARSLGCSARWPMRMALLSRPTLALCWRTRSNMRSQRDIASTLNPSYSSICSRWTPTARTPAFPMTAQAIWISRLWIKARMCAVRSAWRSSRWGSTPRALTMKLDPDRTRSTFAMPIRSPPRIIPWPSWASCAP